MYPVVIEGPPLPYHWHPSCGADSMTLLPDPDTFRVAVRVLANLTDCIAPYGADVDQLKRTTAEDLPVDELARRVILKEIYGENSTEYRNLLSSEG